MTTDELGAAVERVKALAGDYYLTMLVEGAIFYVLTPKRTDPGQSEEWREQIRRLKAQCESKEKDTLLTELVLAEGELQDMLLKVGRLPDGWALPGAPQMRALFSTPHSITLRALRREVARLRYGEPTLLFTPNEHPVIPAIPTPPWDMLNRKFVMTEDEWFSIAQQWYADMMRRIGGAEMQILGEELVVAEKGGSAPGAEPKPAYPTPEGAEWEQVEIVITSETTAKLRAGDGPEMDRHMSFWGLSHARNANKETALWGLLKAFAEKHGQIGSGDKLGSVPVVGRQAVYRLREKLKAIFGIDGNPIPDYSQDEGWKTRFAIRDAQRGG
ncbi:hypothetical protein ACFL09_00290 [Planctomycetota bacterium]